MGLDQDYDRMVLENEELKNQHEDIKGKNRQLFEQITQSHQEGGGHLLMEESIQFNESKAAAAMTTTSHSIIDENGMPIPGAQGVVGGANIGEIHSLYQDLFLTDIKREVENAQTELKVCK